jgi:dTDP-D-glucose 4,6-dehydratase
MHLTAESHIDRSIAGARDFIEANAQENFDKGIEKTVTWYPENEWWWAPCAKATTSAASNF